MTLRKHAYNAKANAAQIAKRNARLTVTNDDKTEETFGNTNILAMLSRIDNLLWEQLPKNVKDLVIQQKFKEMKKAKNDFQKQTSNAFSIRLTLKITPSLNPN